MVLYKGGARVLTLIIGRVQVIAKSLFCVAGIVDPKGTGELGNRPESLGRTGRRTRVGARRAVCHCFEKPKWISLVEYQLHRPGFLRDYGLSRCCIDKILRRSYRRSYRRSFWDGWGAGLFVIAVSFFNILRIEAHFN